MAVWPFTNSVAPTFNTGIQDVPTSLTSVTTALGWLLNAEFTNKTNATIWVSVTETTATSFVVYRMEVSPGGEPKQMPTTFRPLTGLKWQASAVGLMGQMWGYF